MRSTSTALKYNTEQKEQFHLVKQRNNCSGINEVVLSLDQADQVYPVLSNTVNSFELITSRKLSQCSGQFDDAILSWGSGSGLVRDTETAWFRQIKVGVGLFKC